MTGRIYAKPFRNSLAAAVMLLGSFLLLSSSSCNGFSISPTSVSKTQIFTPSRFFTPVRAAFHGIRNEHEQCWSSSTTKTSTSLSMYNLPPGNGGGGDKKDIADIAKSVGTLLLTVGFFVSPLGGFVLGIFNSFLVLAISLPILATVGFQVWSKLYTVKGICPNCGAPATVMKNKGGAGGTNVVDDAMPTESMCFNCGAALQANEDNTGINNVSGRTSIDDLNSSMGGGGSFFDMFTSPTTTTTTEIMDNFNNPGTASTAPSKKSDSMGIDKGSVIDVDVLDEDKPFQ
eukprot:CAMPEP_0168198906 /NCGR_PEP_ID=MMETSP0139_2-20121125/22080_1 /TAXON_ID=44445 /ORGANISM="Pseudo-nitzschia australis, Strain 10249 10 AB" /LENGTH=287 /DNA_ID=CAMNT_0008123741 /DNA_START=174 /DNA_END=1037 /DNA_ORIENTATION=-